MLTPTIENPQFHGSVLCFANYVRRKPIVRFICQIITRRVGGALTDSSVVSREVSCRPGDNGHKWATSRRRVIQLSVQYSIQSVSQQGRSAAVILESVTTACCPRPPQHISDVDNTAAPWTGDLPSPAADKPSLQTLYITTERNKVVFSPKARATHVRAVFLPGFDLHDLDVQTWPVLSENVHIYSARKIVHEKERYRVTVVLSLPLIRLRHTSGLVTSYLAAGFKHLNAYIPDISPEPCQLSQRTRTYIHTYKHTK